MSPCYANPGDKHRDRCRLATRSQVTNAAIDVAIFHDQGPLNARSMSSVRVTMRKNTGDMTGDLPPTQRLGRRGLQAASSTCSLQIRHGSCGHWPDYALSVWRRSD